MSSEPRRWPRLDRDVNLMPGDTARIVGGPDPLVMTVRGGPAGDFEVRAHCGFAYVHDRSAFERREERLRALLAPGRRLTKAALRSVLAERDVVETTEVEILPWRPAD